ncbi:MAG TPA: response regulator [Candidatus Cloacimonadota bacterium]|nr:response regulator [Candidatus Cloacimonadota bacterium]
MKFSAIIIEDENLARQRLQLLLQKHADLIEIIGEAANGEEGLRLIETVHPDLIFLDIQMPGLTGFEMLQKLPELPLVIFTTAYDEYALQAFDTNAIDYLLKPISPERLEKALHKLQQIVGRKDEISAELRAFIDNFNPSKNDYIKVKTGIVTKLIKPAEIYFLHSEDKYTFLHTKEQKFILNESLNKLEKMLPKNFRRIHRSTLINLDQVREIVQLSGNKSIVIMRDKAATELPVSRRLKEML